ncbi:hypothetical protein [[Micrococcus luteus] ATCC 49442]|uniref:hypothetical protein n=1 Tax=[Micrococcus luteus] ATCC 49442 TaxID=2698727 RepID=UPI0013DA4281|nr:hypothetical protein [[Micrococcus luteus] ATCC 49442]
MSVREPSRLRKALLAGAVALALTGAGSAIAWSASDTPTPSPSPSQPAPGKSDKAPGKEKPAKSQRPQHLHSESVVKKADGTFETQLTQQGTVESVSETSVTVKSEDGFTQAYAVNAETRIIKFPAAAADGSPAKDADGKRLRPEEVAIGEIATGVSVRVSGVRSGDSVTAEGIVEGSGTGPGKGMGLGKGLGLGQGHGKESAKGHGRGLEK